MRHASFPWGRAQAAHQVTCETSVFRMDRPSFATERSYGRTTLRLTAPGERLIADAAYELYNVYAVVLDQHGAPLARRSHESGRQYLLGPLCTWAHEIHDEQLDAATSVLYEVETRVDVRRTLLTGKLSPVDFDSEARQAWPLVEVHAEADRLLTLSLGSFYYRGELELFAAGTTPCAHDGHRTELELILRDDQGAVLATKWMNLSINSTGIAYNDTTIRLERRIAKSVASLEVRGRSEVRVIGRIGPILLEETDERRKARLLPAAEAPALEAGPPPMKAAAPPAADSKKPPTPARTPARQPLPRATARRTPPSRGGSRR
jgi:hypothetical protein